MNTLPTPSLNALKKACREFELREGGARCYDVAVAIVDEHPLQAATILLTTWNTGRLRFVKDYSRFFADLRVALEKSLPIFETLRGEDIKTANLDELSDKIAAIYTPLSEIFGVEFTGASKVMHLMNRNLFVMWDKYIRQKYGLQLIVAEGYIQFLKVVQRRFGKIEWDEPEKTFAKAIDEYNYVKYTMPTRGK